TGAVIGAKIVADRLIVADAHAVLLKSALGEVDAQASGLADEVFVAAGARVAGEVAPQTKSVVDETLLAVLVGVARLELGAALVRHTRVARGAVPQRAREWARGGCLDTRVGRLELGRVDPQNRVAPQAPRQERDHRKGREFHVTTLARAEPNYKS